MLVVFVGRIRRPQAKPSAHKYINRRKDAYSRPARSSHRILLRQCLPPRRPTLRDALGHSVTASYFQGKPTSVIKNYQDTRSLPTL